MTKQELFNNVWKRNTLKMEVDVLPYTLDGNAKNSYHLDDDCLTLASNDGVDVVEYMHIPISSLSKKEQSFLIENTEYEEIMYSVDNV